MGSALQCWAPVFSIFVLKFVVGDAALVTLRGGFHLMILSRFHPNAVLITNIFPAIGQIGHPRGSGSTKTCFVLYLPGPMATQEAAEEAAREAICEAA